MPPPGLTFAILLALGAARGPFLRLERIDAARCGEDGIVTAAVAELSLEGELLEIPPSDYRLIVDGANLPAAPEAVRTFRESATPLAMGLVVQANLPFQGDMAAIGEAARSFLRALPPRARVSVSTYADGVRRVATARAPAEAAAALAGLSAGDSAESPALDAFRTALLDLGPLDPNERRLLVVISDGVSDGGDPDAVRAFGNLARSRGVPVHPIAFSATDDRAPLLSLGEIAKRSNGTFRWARTSADLAPQLDNLANEINRQLLLDFEVDDRCERTHTVAVSRGTLRSNVRDTPASQGSGSFPLWAPVAIGAAVTLAGLFVARARSR